jgi:hypothetical protein
VIHLKKLTKDYEGRIFQKGVEANAFEAYFWYLFFVEEIPGNKNSGWFKMASFL